MKGVNKAIILGNVGKDPEVRYATNGSAIAKFSIATTERFKGQDGQVQERTEWHNCKAFGKLAEIVGQYVKKGGKIYVEGQIRTEKWQDKQTGQDKYMTGIVLSELQLLDKPEHAEIPAANRSPHNPQTARTVPPVSADFDDDIPF